MRLVDPENGAPLAGVRVRVLSSKHPLELISDSDGAIWLPMREDLERENPRIVIDRVGSTSLVWSFTASGETGNRRTRYLTLKDLRAIRTGDFHIYYSPGCEAAAGRVHEELQQQYRAIRSVTGLSPVKWAVAIVDTKDPGTDYFVVPETVALPVWCCSRQEIADGSFAKDNAHEWAQCSIDGRLRLADADIRNRFITDGLSEYIVFTHIGMRREYVKALEELQGDGYAAVDLLDKFRCLHVPLAKGLALEIRKTLAEHGFAPGYALSFVFWHELCREYGPGLPAAFLREMGLRETRTTEVAVRVLQELTGLQDIEGRLRRADVNTAIQILQSLQCTQPNLPPTGFGRDEVR